ncbi:helix-turn-helix domain-containing protein [Streptomyces sp. NPDC090025]|uniref:helix-turn-helix domain-containing protein n=1 Tax=Streptomyces sp. NPDC090025 TaxID=3365922 RepID=UPI003832A502
MNPDAPAHSLKFPPAALLRSAVRNYSSYSYDRAPRRRVLTPNTVATINFAFGEPVVARSLAGPDVPVQRIASQAHLPATSAYLASHDGQVSGVVVRMTPMGAYRLFGVPMAHWDATDLDPTELLPRFLRLLPERLRATAPRERAALLDRTLLPLLDAGPRVSPEVSWAWRELHRTKGRVRTAQLAADTLYSVRHLERRFREQVGRSPATIARILRFGHALRLQEAGVPLAQVAERAGYHDQAHFTRAFRTMSGYTPTQLPRAERIDWSWS